MSKRDHRPPAGDNQPHALARSEPPLEVAIDRFDPWAQDNAPPAGPRGARAFQFGRLLRYKWSILGVALLIAVPVVAGVWLMIKPKYQARATLRISPRNERVIFHTEETGMIPMYQQYLNSQVGIMLARVILGRVIDEAAVQETTWYKELVEGGAASDDAVFEQLKKDLKVRPRGRTFLIDIDMTAPKVSDAVLIVKRVVHHYLDYSARSSLRPRNNRDTVLRDEQQKLKASIETRERMTDGLSRDLATRDPDMVTSQQGAQIAAADTEIRRLKRELKMVEFDKAALTKLLEGDVDKSQSAVEEDVEGGDESSRATARYEADLGWRQAFLKLRNTEDARERDSVGLGEKHPKLQRMRLNVEQARKRLEEVQTQLDERWAAGTTAGIAPRGEGASLSGAIAKVDRTIDRLNEAIRLHKNDKQELIDKFNDSFGNAQLYNKEMGELRFDRQKYGLFRERLYQTEMEGATGLSITEITPAFGRSSPLRDRRLLFSAMAVFAGLAGGLGLAYMRLLSDKTIDTIDDVIPSARTPFLAYLPQPRTSAAINGDGAIQREHYRMLRTALLNRIQSDGANALLITSAGPNAGKTTVAINVAKSLAECGKRVLLVDADMRNADITERMGLQPGPGLVAVLRGEATDAEALVQSDTAGLSVLPAGTIETKSDGELLANGKFEACLNRWREAFDVILFDAPPVLPVADAQILAGHLDGTILVTRERHCLRDEIQATLTQLEAAGGRLLGTIFIGSDSKPTYYGYRYSGQYAAQGAPGTDPHVSDESAGPKRG